MPCAIPSWIARTGSAPGPTDPNTRSAIPACMSCTLLAAPPSASPASSPAATLSSERIRSRRDLGVRVGQPLDAFLDLVRCDAGVGERQRAVSTLEHEV